MKKPRLYNSRIIDTYLKLLKERYPAVSVPEILEYAGMKKYETADQGHWFNQAQIDLFHEKCVQLTGNANIAREAGRYAASPGTLGVMRQYSLSLAGPLKAFSLIESATRKLTLSSQYQFRKITNNKVEIAVRVFSGVKEKPFQCQNRIGFFEAILALFHVGNPRVEHPECMFRGDELCRYLISWRHSRATKLKRLRDAILLAGTLVLLLSLVVEPWKVFAGILPVTLILSCMAGWVFDHARAAELERSMGHYWETSDQLADQIEHNYRNTRFAAEVGDVIANRTSISAVIRSVASVLEKSLDFDRGLILLATEDRTRLEIRGVYGYLAQHIDILNQISFNLDNPKSRGMFVVAFREQRPFLVNDVNEIEDSLSSKSRDFLHALKTKSFLCVPIILQGKSIGVLAVDNLTSKNPLLASDVNLLMGIAPSIAVSILNARLLENRAAQFDATLQIMADSIDARDTLTAGHSENVAEYAVGIAQEMGLGVDSCHIIRRAALLHDYGKIGIPDSILKKGGPLSDEERAVIQTHPAKTKQILDKVGFEGPYAAIPEICHAHHEKWDGTGYPHALKGDEIPFEARILAAADFYEAITAERHYRRPMDCGEARMILRSEAGKHFQPEVVEALIRHLERASVSRKTSYSQVVGTTNGLLTRVFRTQVSTQQAGKVFTGNSVHISPGEIYVKCLESTRLIASEPVEVTFALPSSGRLARVKGVVGVINANFREDQILPPGFSIFFSDMDDETRDVLQDYVDDTMIHGPSSSQPA